MAKDFGRLRIDDNSREIPSGNTFATQDATGTPQASPLAITTGVTTIAIPTNAAEIGFYGDAAIRFSEIVGMTRFVTVPANTFLALGVAEMDSIYFRADSGTANLHFWFIEV